MGVLDREPPRRMGSINTRWSMLLNLEDRQDPAWEISWTYLSETYRRPMQGYVRRVLSRATGRTPDATEVEEVVQAFLAACVEKDWLTRADRDVGRFRAFAQTLLKRYAYSHVRHQRAKKRSPGEGQALLSLDEELDTAPDDPAGAADASTFDREWAQTVLERSLERLRLERERYHAVIADLLATDGAGSPDLAERLDVRPKQLPVLKHRARQRFATIFVEELRATVRDEEEFQDEWRALAPYLPCDP